MDAKKGRLDVRIHGRGGQGAKTAAQIIAETALEEGKHIRSFPEYGPERTGAPVKAYVRISDKEIKTYQPVINPDVVIVIDATLMESVDVVEGLGEKGVLIINSNKKREELKKEIKFDSKGSKCKIYTVDATKIAINTVGRNLPNTPMLGSFVKITKAVNLEKLKERIKDKFLHKIGAHKTDATIQGIQQGYEMVQ